MSMAEGSGFYRLACERCRGQKLRCNWADRRPDASCNRCLRAGVVCKTNYSRRVGRPPRYDLPNASQQQQWSMPPSSPTTASTTAPPSAAPEEVQQQQHHQERDEYGTLSQHAMPQNTFENGRTGASDMLGHDSMSLEASVVTLEKTATNQSGTSSAPSSLHNGTALYANNSQAHGINQMSLGDMATSEAEDESRWMSYVVDLNTTTGSELPIDRSFSLSSSNMSSEYPSTNFPFDLSMAGTEPSNAGHAFARDSSSKDSRGPGSSTAASDWRKELGKLGADLYELPPAHPHQPVTQSGVWIMLVPKVVDHAKTLYRLANRASSNYTPPPTVTNQSTKQPNKGRLSSEDQLPMDRPTWLILLSCYTRTLQVCRYTLGSIYMTLKTDRGLFAVLQLEGTMMAEDEPHLKILLLLQVLSYRLNTIAAALSLPRQHRLQGSGATGGDRATEKEVSTGTADALAADWALRGDIAERSVFGSPDCKKENITAAFLAEYEIIVGLVSEQ